MQSHDCTIVTVVIHIYLLHPSSIIRVDPYAKNAELFKKKREVSPFGVVINHSVSHYLVFELIYDKSKFT